MHPRHFIQRALAKKGAKGGLHRSLGVPEGQKIPEDRIEAATHSENPKTRKQANFAKTLEGLRR